MSIKYIVVKNSVKVGDDFLTKEFIAHGAEELFKYLEESRAYRFTLQVSKVVDKQA